MDKGFRLLLILLSLLVPTSCGMIQINELVIVTAVGIEPGSQPDTVRLSAQIVRPADARGQTGAPSGGTGEPIYSISAEGESIFDAIRKLARFSSRRVYWAHNFVIVINDQYAKRGIADLIDFFTRNHELRMNTLVVVTSSQASEVVSTITGLEVVPGQAIDNLFRYNDIVGEAPRTTIMRLYEAYLSPTSHPVLARVELKKRGISNKKPQEYGSLKQVELSGAAVFNKDQMIGWLTPEESRGLLLFIGTIQSAVETVPCPDDAKTGKVSLEVSRQNAEVIPSVVNGKPHFQVNVDASAHYVESGCKSRFPDIRLDLEEELRSAIQGHAQAVLKKAQESYKVDFLKFGEYFNNRYPGVFKNHRHNWDQVFSEADVEINVRTKITSPVLKMDGHKELKRGTS